LGPGKGRLRACKGVDNKTTPDPDPEPHFSLLFPLATQIADDQGSGISSMMQDLAFAIPGVDEAMGFAEVMKYDFFSFCYTTRLPVILSSSSEVIDRRVFNSPLSLS